MEFSGANTDIAELASARKVFAVLVERDSHDAVGGVEGFLDAVAVVNVDVDVENAWVEAEEFQNAKHDV